MLNAKLSVLQFTTVFGDLFLLIFKDIRFLFLFELLLFSSFELFSRIFLEKELDVTLNVFHDLLNHQGTMDPSPSRHFLKQR